MNDMISAFAAVASATASIGESSQRVSTAEPANRSVKAIAGAHPGVESVADTFLLLPQAVTAGSFQRQLQDNFPSRDLSRPAGSSLPTESPAIDENGAPRALVSRVSSASLDSESALTLIAEQKGGGSSEPRAIQSNPEPTQVDIAR